MFARTARRLLAPSLLVLGAPATLSAHSPGTGILAHLHPHGLDYLLAVLAVAIVATIVLRRRNC